MVSILAGVKIQGLGLACTWYSDKQLPHVSHMFHATRKCNVTSMVKSFPAHEVLVDDCYTLAAQFVLVRCSWTLRFQSCVDPQRLT